MNISTLRKQLTRVKDKDPLLKKAGVVYKTPCSCGIEYIGETRNLETCLKEHQEATRQGEIEKSAIAEHAWAKQHHPSWDEIKILDQASNNNTIIHVTKEAFHILHARQQKPLNKDQGTANADCWKPLLRCMCKLQAITNDPAS